MLRIDAAAGPGLAAGIARNLTRDWKFLLLLGVVYALIFVVYYPPIPGIEDEVGFINQAILWTHGALNAEDAGIANTSSLNDLATMHGKHVPWRNPGRSLLILPFLFTAGVRSLFLSGLLIHLLTVLVSALLLVQNGCSPLWGVPILFHPTLLLYSRTVMGDAPAAMFLLLAVLLLNRKQPAYLAAGAMAGLASIMRYHALIAVAPLLLVAYSQAEKSQKARAAFRFLLFPATAVALIAFYNKLMYDTWAGVTWQGTFGLRFVTGNLAFYFTALNLVWPLMLLGALAVRAPVTKLLAAISLPFLILFSFYYFHDKTSNRLETLIVGQRLLIIALPALILMYVWPLRKAALRLRAFTGEPLAHGAALACCLILALSQLYIFKKHNDYLAHLLAARQAIERSVPAGSLIVANGTLAKLFGVLERPAASYRWAPLYIDGQIVDNSDAIRLESRDWYVASLTKEGASTDPALALYRHNYGLARVSTPLTELSLFHVFNRGQRTAQNIASPMANAR